MFTKLDWISFSFRRPIASAEEPQQEIALILDSLRMLLTEEIYTPLMDGNWQIGKGRPPYEACYRHPSGGINLYFHTHLDHALIEASGIGMDWLVKQPWYERFLTRIQHRVTRLDLACDMLTATSPTLFVAARDQGRRRSHCEIVSESGTTAYVGSRTSNRYARVYRYNPPHERSHLLRCEYVVKQEDAKACLAAVLEYGQMSVAKKLGEEFGWWHPDWSPDVETSAELVAYRAERKEGKTLFWLEDTIAPLLLRLDAEKVIDLPVWFDEILAKRKK